MGLRRRRARDPAHLADARAEPVPELEDGREAARLGDARTGSRGDRAYLAHATPALRGYVGDARRRSLRAERAARARALLVRHPRPRLRPARAGGRLAGPAAMAGVWAATGSRRSPRGRARSQRGSSAASAARCALGAAAPRRLALRAGAPARRRAAVRALTQERAGSYWNLVMPYALASGLFAARSPEARGVLRYMLLHGSRLLGPRARRRLRALRPRRALPRLGAPTRSTAINVARFLADMRRSRPARAQPLRPARRRR